MPCRKRYDVRQASSGSPQSVSLHQIISCISLFLQEPQNPFDIDVPSAQRGKSVFVQILQVDEGDSVVILLTISRGSPPPAARCARSGQILMSLTEKSRSICSGFSAMDEVRVVACLDAVGGEDLFCLLQPLARSA